MWGNYIRENVWSESSKLNRNFTLSDGPSVSLKWISIYYATDTATTTTFSQIHPLVSNWTSLGQYIGFVLLIIAQIGVNPLSPFAKYNSLSLHSGLKLYLTLKSEFSHVNPNQKSSLYGWTRTKEPNYFHLRPKLCILDRKSNHNKTLLTNHSHSKFLCSQQWEH